MKTNIAIAGGPCTGKSTLAAALFAELKFRGLDYDLIGEESRKLRKEFGHFRSPFERFYMWIQQEREELRSCAQHGFVTDTPLFHFYVQARIYKSESRDVLAVRELFRSCQKISDRYQLITLPANPFEIPYKTDSSRSLEERKAREKHACVKRFLEHEWPERILYVEGPVKKRVRAVLQRMKQMNVF